MQKEHAIEEIFIFDTNGVSLFPAQSGALLYILRPISKDIRTNITAGRKSPYCGGEGEGLIPLLSLTLRGYTLFRERGGGTAVLFST
jgi:hypothetical protein